MARQDLTPFLLLAGYLVGCYVLRLNPVLLLGSLTGSRISDSCLRIINQEARKYSASLGYTDDYAFTYSLLMMAGTLTMLSREDL